MRSSKLTVYIRSCLVVFFIFLPLSWVWNELTQTYFWKPSEMAIAAVITVTFYGGFSWLVTNLGMGLMFGNNPQYQNYKNNGGDPFMDNLPRVLNPDSQAVRQAGREKE